jgi:hypothetical protein
MQSKSATFFKVLINRFHPGINPAFFKCLPPEDVKDATSAITSSLDTSIAFTWPQRLISKTHYSWLIPYIEKLSSNMKSLVIAALPEAQSKGISKLLNIPSLKMQLSPNIKSFLINQLYQKWQPEEALPPELLPPSNLHELLELSKPELVDLIDLLAMHDLTEAIRHIVDKKNLKAIYLCLSPEKQKFLRLCLHKREKLAAPKLDISKWNGSQEQLNAILHRRGMLRLGKALGGQNRQFLWNLVHTLDTGRGQTISEYYQEEQIPGVTPLLVQQVLSVINFLKHKSDA